MKKTPLFFFVLLFTIQETFAQNSLPPVFELQNDTATHEILPNAYWQMLEDKDGKLAFEAVSQSPLKDQFHYDSARRIDFHVPTYWFRFVLRNSANRPLKIGFYEDSKANSDWFIRGADGKSVHKASGLETPWSKNESLKFMRYFTISTNFLPLTVDSGELLVIYNRAHYNYFNYSYADPRQFTISFGSTDKAILENYVGNESHYFNSVQDAFFFGIMLLAAIFNFFSFLIIRERTYLYFALYVFFLGFGRFNIDSEFYLVLLREHPGFYAYFSDFIWTFSLFFLTYFLRSLLNTKKYYPRWDKFLVYFNLLNSVFFVGSFFIDYCLRGTDHWGIANILSFILSSILEVSLVISIFLFLRKTIFFERRFLLAILPSFVIWTCGIIIFNLLSLGLLGNHFQPPGFIQWENEHWHVIETICLFWQVLCFSWLLFHRFIELRNQVVKNELEKEIERGQLMAQQKLELEKQVNIRTAELKQSLENLKATQSQLIQSEKMASLGELTAGIAHEIQNPLNFVNNFSEVNTDLIDELQAELKSGNSNEALTISNNIRTNEEKINFHGKRADAIVKGMLQHSQLSAGKKEPADINLITDEYLRLAYHGLRAKDKTFKATLNTHYDQSIGKINIISQDIGRLLLNLYNNAFYAVAEKLKIHTEGYDPTVSVITKRLDGKVEIRVKDNGMGIPSKSLDKIFQPFFTTKPPGQGTGLGLSLSYDIVKAHGGELKVETKEGEGAEFVVQIPGEG